MYRALSQRQSHSCQKRSWSRSLPYFHLSTCSLANILSFPSNYQLPRPHDLLSLSSDLLPVHVSLPRWQARRRRYAVNRKKTLRFALRAVPSASGLPVLAGGNWFWRRGLSQTLSKTHPGSSAGGAEEQKAAEMFQKGQAKKLGMWVQEKLLVVCSSIKTSSVASQDLYTVHARSFLQVPLVDSRKLVTWTCYMVVLPPAGRRWHQDKLCSGSPAVDARWCFLDGHKDKANFFLTQLGFYKLSCYYRDERWYHNDSLIIHYTFHRRFISIFFNADALSKTSCLMAKHNLDAMWKKIKALFPLWLPALNAGFVHNREEFTP